MNATDAADTDLNLNIELIEIDVLKPSKTNARKVFSKEGIAQLAANIKQHGVLQPILVRVHPNDADCFEIIAGERRYRASKKAKLNTIPCRIIESGDVDSLEKQASENLFREDLNPIEEAYTWLNLLEETGLTQQKLATRYKTSQAHIANRIRLLKLPEEWQQKLVDGEIPPTFARDLVPWAKYPQVFEALPDTIEEIRNNYAEGYVLGPMDFREALEEALHAVTVSVHEANFSVTDDLKKELQVEEFRNAWGAPIERAFNTDLFHELQEKAKAEQKQFMESSGSGSKSTRKNGSLFNDDDEDGIQPVEREVQDTRSPEDVQADIDHAERQAAKKRKEQLGRKYADWKCAWYQQKISEQLDHRKPSDGFLFKLLLFYSITMDNGVNDFRGEHLRSSVKTWGGKIKGERYRLRANSWEGLGSVQSSSKDLAATTLAQYILIPIGHNAFDHSQIGEIAKELAIDIETEWELTEDFLQLHTKPQLLELSKEWKFPQDGLEDLKRGELIDRILEMESQLRLEFEKGEDKKQEPASCPKALAKTKLPQFV
ncbi:ParB/RepB/Spo0J family partition protein [Gimesia algae]|uniref:Nucleoid occlusion protein n=1 Tax=Gimesia algae TaxID=2527971 RepID=A0A517VMS6_9PLAN|nr:ParB/RepB/Spo0J family partition protein [Gimesia algae]QDT94296.1 Nucleoid occlusion protein [Gimesia algae]